MTNNHHHAHSWPMIMWSHCLCYGNCEEELPKKPVGRLSAVCWPTVGRLLADCWPSVGRLSADRRPAGFPQNIDYQSADSRPTNDRQSADSWRFFAYFQLCRRSVSSWVCRVMHHHYGMLHHVNCSCLPQFSFFLNVSVTCWLTVGRLSVTCRSTDGRQLTDSRPTGFLGSSSSQLPMLLVSVFLYCSMIAILLFANSLFVIVLVPVFFAPFLYSLSVLNLILSKCLYINKALITSTYCTFLLHIIHAS